MNTTMEVTESSISMCNQFDIKGKKGTILKGTVFVYYEPFDDVPMEKSFLGSVLKNFVIGALVAVACVAAAVLIPGLGALAVAALWGAATGAIVGTVVMTGQALWTKESKSTSEAVREIAINTVCGAIGGMIPGSGLLMFGVGGAVEGTVDRYLRGEEITLKTLAFDFCLSAITAGVLDGIGRKTLGKAGKEGAEELADNVVDKIGKEATEEIAERTARMSGGKITISNIGKYDFYQQQAEKFYQQMRDDFNNIDVQQIAKNTGFSEEQILDVKNHLFRNEIPFEDGRIELFIPDIDQSLAWKRMMEGENILDTDILLLNHEITEIDFFRNNPGSVYEQAHAAANLDYNWGDAIEDYVELDELY